MKNDGTGIFFPEDTIEITSTKEQTPMTQNDSKDLCREAFDRWLQTIYIYPLTDNEKLTAWAGFQAAYTTPSPEPTADIKTLFIWNRDKKRILDEAEKYTELYRKADGNAPTNKMYQADLQSESFNMVLLIEEMQHLLERFAALSVIAETPYNPVNLPLEWYALKGYLQALEKGSVITDEYKNTLFEYYIPKFEQALTQSNEQPAVHDELVKEIDEALKMKDYLTHLKSFELAEALSVLEKCKQALTSVDKGGGK